jgi:hypothetical protein
MGDSDDKDALDVIKGPLKVYEDGFAEASAQDHRQEDHDREMAEV